MTRGQEIFAKTLNLLGSDIPDKDMQEIIDHEHAMLDATYRKVWEQRHKRVLDC